MLIPNITLYASGDYYRLNNTIPIGEWVNFQLIARGNMTFAAIISPNRDVLVIMQNF